MARSSLKVDTGDLRSLSTTLVEVKAAFESSGGVTDDAEACGHAGLVERVRSFSSQWNDSRRELSESIGDLGEAALGLAVSFDDVDGELAESLGADS